MRFSKAVILMTGTCLAYSVSAATASAGNTPDHPTIVTVGNFVRAETDTYFRGTAQGGGFGKLAHRRALASLDKQDVVRMNRDTLYSSGVFDLDAGPLTVSLPDASGRFMSMQVISEDHYTIDVAYDPGPHRYDRDQVGTRYVYVIIRTLVDPGTSGDVEAVNRLQDAIKVQQAATGSFEVPNWDSASQAKVRAALSVLGGLRGKDKSQMFGKKAEVDPVAHLLGTATGWGGNPPDAAVYKAVYPAAADGSNVHRLTVKDVPVDGFWSISVYDKKGFFEKNSLGMNSLNSLTARKSDDGSYTVQFGGCEGGVPNCLPIMKDWNYTVRLYRPRPEILDGTWMFPEAKQVN